MTDHHLDIISHSVEETLELGAKLGSQLQGGELFALIGDLGAGKTHFIKGMVQGLAQGGVEAVTSPTFTLINEYVGRLHMYHVDAYRLDNAAQLAALGFEEMLDDHTVMVIEWADRVDELLSHYAPTTIRITHRAETERTIRINDLPNHLKL